MDRSVIVCPYKTYRYHRGCSITVEHLHWPRWSRPIRSWLRDGVEWFEQDNLSLFMVNRWWPASRERRAG